MKLGVRGQGLFIILGMLLVAAGLVAVVRPFVDVRERNAADTLALKAWQAGGSLNIQGAVQGHPVSIGASTVGCTSGASAADAYALVTFPGLPSYGYAGVAVDGDWNGLLSRSMVHWHGSPAPGQPGNMIIAFHREPDYEHIDELAPGQIVNVQDRACHTYGYRLSSREDLDPAKVTQLVPTAGHDLTLITCTPFWQDYHRLVWRGALVSKDGKPFTG